MNKTRRIVYNLEDIVLFSCILVLFFILTATGFNVFEKTSFRILFTLLSVVMSLVVGGTVFSLKRKNQKAEEEWFEVKKKQMEYTMGLNYQKETKALQDEFKNIQEEQSLFYNRLYDCLVEKKYNEVEKLLRGKKTESFDGELFFSGNRVLDVVISQKSFRASEENIHIKCDVQCPDISYIKETDLNVLLSNLLDNAIEAVLRWKKEGGSEEDEAIISLTIRKHRNYLVILEENPCIKVLQGKNKRLKTTKTDKKHHGIGMQSMERIAVEYNGLIDFHVLDGCFSIKVILEDKLNG
ncbi:MAG: sensor histidine kinase [Lachnospiraceae bacterium]|jgi:hypothetical protein|nr:sensor histidine kinase [Lachnospiraceae bacterium]